MFSRSDRGKLMVSHLDVQVMFDDFFMKCKTESEIEWMKDILESCIETCSDDAIENL